MVPKDALEQLFIEKVETPLKQLKDNKVNIENYASNVRAWFSDYKKDIIERAGFERFLKHLEAKTIDTINDVKDVVKPKVIDAVNTFLEEVESHTSEEITEEIESVIKNIGGDLESIAKRKNLMKMPGRWKKIVLIMFILLICAAGIYYMMFLYPQNSDNGIEDLEQEDSTVENLQNENDANPAEENQGIPEEVVIEDEQPRLSDAFEISDKPSDVLTPIETQVITMINTQRESYYLNKYEIDLEYTKSLKNGSEDIPSVLNIETVIFEVDQELALKGDDIPLAIFNQMNKNNMFKEDLTKIAINIEQIKYKLYHVQLAFY